MPNVKEVIIIDPSTVSVKNKTMTDSERAFLLARKYKSKSQTLHDIFDKYKNRKLGKAVIETVNNIVANIKNQI